MKLRLPFAIYLLSLVFALNAPAAQYWWDGGNVNIGGNGNGTSTFNSGTWSTSIANWDQGAGQPYMSWPTSGTNTAIFGGNGAGSTAIVTLGTNITVSQIIINPTGSYGYGSFTGGIVTFNGSYNASTPTISTVNATTPALTFASQITGDLSASGGLVLALGGNPSTFDGQGRFFLSNSTNDFIGDITITSGFFAFTLGGGVTNSRMGNVANKIILNGGAVTAWGGDVALPSRQIEVGVNGGAISTAYSGTTLNYTYAGAITGTGTLTRYHSSNDTPLSLDGSLSGYTGNFTNANGTTLINSTAASGGQWTVNGGILKFGASNKIVGGASNRGNFTINGGTLDLNGTTQSINGLAGSAGTVSSSVAGAVTLTLGSGDASASYGGAIANGHASAVVSLIKTGSGTQTLTGANTYTGLTDVQAGTLRYGANNVIAGGAVRVSGGTLDLVTFSDTVGAVTMQSGSITSTTGTLTGTSYAVESGSISAKLGGSGSFTKSTGGTVTLSGVNTYTGSTLVTAGTLVVSGSGSINASSGVTVNGGTLNYSSSTALTSALTFTSGTLAGTNFSGKTLSIGANQTISPGNSTGTLVSGAQTWAGNGTYTWEINDATGTAGGNGWDLLSINGALTITATSGTPFNLNVVSLASQVAGQAANFNSLVDGAWLIADATSAITTFDASVFNLSLAGFQNAYSGIWSVALGGSGSFGGDSSQIYLTYSAIPEPSTNLLLTAGLMTMLFLRRRPKI